MSYITLIIFCSGIFSIYLFKKCFKNKNNYDVNLPNENFYIPPTIINNPIKQHINKLEDTCNDIELEDFTQKKNLETSLPESWITISSLKNDGNDEK